MYAFSENKVTGHIELEGLESISYVDAKREQNKGIAIAANNNDKSAVHIYAHGSPSIFYNENEKTVSEQQITSGKRLNSLLGKLSSEWKETKDHSGMTVVIHSCRTGKCTTDANNNAVDPIAQVISGSEEFKGVTIIAPTERDYFDDSGKEIGPYVSKFTDNNSDYKPNIPREKHGQRTNERGKWNVFKDGKLVGSYDGNWTPKGNPRFFDNLFYKKN